MALIPLAPHLASSDRVGSFATFDHEDGETPRFFHALTKADSFDTMLLLLTQAIFADHYFISIADSIYKEIPL